MRACVRACVYMYICVYVCPIKFLEDLEDRKYLIKAGPLEAISIIFGRSFLISSV